ncbi:hypothetical protein M9458_031711 [Cirrhinus mrigala]|uniref:Uncharacterized protein n=1 Tax=Cirrhinus mrigala TaxID=683832 RepID=A0ABD0PCE1_CIRMR
MCDSASVTVSPRKAEEGQETQYPGQQQQPQGTCPLPSHHRDGHASTQMVADKAPRQSPLQLRRAGPIGPRMATANPATQPAAWVRQGMEPRALWAQEQPPHPHWTRGPANAQEDQAAPGMCRNPPPRLSHTPGDPGSTPRPPTPHPTEPPGHPLQPPPHQPTRPPPTLLHPPSLHATHPLTPINMSCKTHICVPSSNPCPLGL